MRDWIALSNGNRFVSFGDVIVNEVGVRPGIGHLDLGGLLHLLLGRLGLLRRQKLCGDVSDGLASGLVRVSTER